MAVWMLIGFGAVIAASVAVLFGFDSIANNRRIRGYASLSGAAALMVAGCFCLFSVLPTSSSYCPPGERLNGAAGRILWCSP